MFKFKSAVIIAASVISSCSSAPEDRIPENQQQPSTYQSEGPREELEPRQGTMAKGKFRQY